jgi:hypothetical protein
MAGITLANIGTPTTEEPSEPEEEEVTTMAMTTTGIEAEGDLRTSRGVHQTIRLLDHRAVSSPGEALLLVRLTGGLQEVALLQDLPLVPREARKVQGSLLTTRCNLDFEQKFGSKIFPLGTGMQTLPSIIFRISRNLRGWGASFRTN